MTTKSPSTSDPWIPNIKGYTALLPALNVQSGTHLRCWSKSPCSVYGLVKCAVLNWIEKNKCWPYTSYRHTHTHWLLPQSLATFCELLHCFHLANEREFATKVLNSRPIDLSSRRLPLQCFGAQRPEKKLESTPPKISNVYISHRAPEILAFGRAVLVHADMNGVRFEDKKIQVQGTSS